MHMIRSEVSFEYAKCVADRLGYWIAGCHNYNGMHPCIDEMSYAVVEHQCKGFSILTARVR
jgi:hypothetical protein